MKKKGHWPVRRGGGGEKKVQEFYIFLVKSFGKCVYLGPRNGLNILITFEEKRLLDSMCMILWSLHIETFYSADSDGGLR